MRWVPIERDYIHGILEGYRLSYEDISYNSTKKVTTVNKFTTEIELNGLKKFTEYKIRVAAYTSRGRGPFSLVVKVKTAEDGEWNKKCRIGTSFK